LLITTEARIESPLGNYYRDPKAELSDESAPRNSDFSDAAQASLTRPSDPGSQSSTMANPFHTIGHSKRPVSEFVALLEEAEIQLVGDVRSVPRSRANPQYDRSVLPKTLQKFQIEYEHLPELGGLRGRSADVATSVNAFWENPSFHNYADYAMGEKFRFGLKKLLDLGSGSRCAIMCAEAVWWRCHRRIIADYLLASGSSVFHILARGRIEQAHITPEAILGSTGIFTYPARAN